MALRFGLRLRTTIMDYDFGLLRLWYGIMAKMSNGKDVRIRICVYGNVYGILGICV